MSVPGLGRIKRLAQRAYTTIAPGAIILLYHRVAELPADPQWLAVSPRNFESHLRTLRHRAHPLSLRQLAHRLRAGAAPRRAVVVTFDDGYADNLHIAKPLLARHNIPATVFVTSGQTDSAREFWWDELERLLLCAGMLPPDLTVVAGGRMRQWSLRDAAHYSPEAAAQYRGWTVLSPTDPTPRHTLYRQLCDLVRPLAAPDREAVLASVRAWAGAGAEGRATHRALTAAGLRQLAADGLVEVGAHTVTHPVLASLPLEAQRAEMAQSKTALEAALGAPVTSFAYPYGTRSDYTPDTVALARQAGFEQACSNFPGAARRGTDPFQLPRMLVRDWPADEFARRLDGWLRD